MVIATKRVIVKIWGRWGWTLSHREKEVEGGMGGLGDEDGDGGMPVGGC